MALNVAALKYIWCLSYGLFKTFKTIMEVLEFLQNCLIKQLLLKCFKLQQTALLMANKSF